MFIHDLEYRRLWVRTSLTSFAETRLDISFVEAMPLVNGQYHFRFHDDYVRKSATQ